MKCINQILNKYKLWNTIHLNKYFFINKKCAKMLFYKFKSEMLLTTINKITASTTSVKLYHAKYCSQDMTRDVERLKVQVPHDWPSHEPPSLCP